MHIDTDNIFHCAIAKRGLPASDTCMIMCSG